MKELLREAERLKLARAFDCAPEALAFLDGLPAPALRRLREAATRSLLDQHRDLFTRIARSGRLVPAAISARLSEQVFGPLITARVAGLMEPERAVKVSARLSVAFQAELCLYLDPASAPEVLRRIPLALVADVTRVLAERREYITMARFVDSLSDAALRQVLEVLGDEALIRIGFYVESDPRLSRLMEWLPPDRLQGMVALGHRGDAELRQAAVALLSRVEDRVKGRLGDLAAQQGDGLLETVIGNLRQAGADQALAAMLSHMSQPHRV